MSTEQREPVLSKNLAFAAIAGIIALGIIGVVLLYVLRPDATANFIQTVVTFAGILTTAITLLYGLGKIGDRVEVVQKQTNGNLAARDAIIAEKDAIIARLQDEKVELAKQLPPGTTP